MKLMKSRFRLISLLLTCAFIVALVFCAVACLKTSGITLPKLPELPVSSPSPSGEIPEQTPVMSSEPSSPEKTEEPETEYNVFGL